MWVPASPYIALSAVSSEINSENTQNVTKRSPNFLKLFTGCAPTIEAIEILRKSLGGAANGLKLLRFPGSQCIIVPPLYCSCSGILSPISNLGDLLCYSFTKPRRHRLSRAHETRHGHDLDTLVSILADASAPLRRPRSGRCVRGLWTAISSGGPDSSCGTWGGWRRRRRRRGRRGW